MAALTIGVGFTEPHQVLNLVMRLVSVGLGLFFILLLLGAGDISSFGLESITINRGNTQVIVTIDMRLILYITVASTLLKLVEVILGFREARSELSADIPKASP